MVRRFEPEARRVSKPTYWIFVIVIVVLWVWAFKLYFDRYEYLHPEVTWAVPGVDTQVAKIGGVLLWKEALVTARSSGVVSYPLGTGPVRVARGAVVARITSGGKVTDIKAYQQGYFIAGIDGAENSWRYAEIWPGDKIPTPPNFARIKDGLTVGSGQPVGKMIEQPQELRFVGYVKPVGDMAEQIKKKTLRVKMDADDTVSRADVRVSMESGGKTKLYVTLPWFPPEMLKSRRFTLLVDAGQTKGAFVPLTAILDKDGQRGVYLVKGSRVVFKQVEGKPMNNGNFIVTKGVSVGDAIVEDASSAREGRIQLW